MESSANYDGTMAFPALRQPKFMELSQENNKKEMLDNVHYVILTLRDNTKLVINSDAYHGILMEEEMYRCVFCEALMDPNETCKETHKTSNTHQEMMKHVPYLDEFAASLVRKLNKEHSYCTICNVVVPLYSVVRHMTSESHTQEAGKAVTRANIYKPNNPINKV